MRPSKATTKINSLADTSSSFEMVPEDWSMKSLLQEMANTTFTPSNKDGSLVGEFSAPPSTLAPNFTIEELEEIIDGLPDEMFFPRGTWSGWRANQDMIWNNLYVKINDWTAIEAVQIRNVQGLTKEKMAVLSVRAMENAVKTMSAVMANLFTGKTPQEW